MDVKTAFLNGDLEAKIYMTQPEGSIVSSQEHKVCRLAKSLYWLKQASKQWHEKFDTTLLLNGYMVNESNRCVYSKFNKNSGVVICLYVDDMLIFRTSLEVVKTTKKFLSSTFDMKYLGEADAILGIKILRSSTGPMLNKSHYVEKILKKFG